MARSSGLAGRILGWSAASRFVALLERRSSWPADHLAVVTYHRVDELGDRSGRYPGLVSATPAEFEEQMGVLARHCNPVDSELLLAALARRRALPPRAVLVTFDDATSDFAEHVGPTLARYDIPAVLFVPTGYVDDPTATFWWDGLHAAVSQGGGTSVGVTGLGRLDLRTDRERRRTFQRLRTDLKAMTTDEASAVVATLCDELSVTPPSADVLTWDQLRELAGNGVAICGHTRTHANLDRIPRSDVVDEVEGSMADLRREIGDGPPLFAYPGGRLAPEVVDVVRAAGIEGAFTTERGTNRIGSADPLRLRRINMSRRMGINGVRVQMIPQLSRLAAASRLGR